MADETESAGFAGRLEQALVGAHAKVSGAINDKKKEHVANVLDQFEADIAPLLEPLVAEVLANPGTPEHLKALLTQIGAPEHFSSSLLIGVAVGAIIGPVLGSAVQPYVQDISNKAWSVNSSAPLSPALLAEAVIKGVYTDAGAAQTEAALSGVNADRFSTMVATAGQAIGIEQALLLYRRGDITEAELRRVVQYSNVRDDFFPDVLKLQYVPPSASEAIVGALKHHLQPADAKIKFGQAGIDPSNFDWLLASAGRPLGLEQMLHLLNRKVMTEADVRQGIAQSDVNDDYADWAIALQHYYPPPRSLVPMLRAEAITEAQFRTFMSYYGASDDVVEAFLKEATKPANSSVKELSASVVVRLYEQKIIQRAEALTRLEALKYNATDADLYLQVADDAVKERFLAAGANRVHSRYISYKIDHAAALAALAKEGQPPDAAAQLMALWSLERDANTSVLTLSQIQQGYHRGIITLAEFVSMVQERGYSGLAVKILAAEAWPPAKVPPAVLALNAGSL